MARRQPPARSGLPDRRLEGIIGRMPYIVRRPAIPSGPRASLWPRPLARLDPRAQHRLRLLLGYASAVAGVALASGCIGVILRFVRFSNISLLYLLVVLWLAAVFGRGPAIAASILSFVAYDFFFIPPLHRLTIGNPTEWLSLTALLATSLVLGQLTAAAQARARDAVESEQRTATLHALSQLIVAEMDHEALLPALAARMVDVFSAAGIGACSIILADEHGQPVERALVPARDPFAWALSLTARERFAEAAWALQHGSAAGRVVPAPEDEPIATDERVVLYVPLRSARGVVGVLGIAGTSRIRALVAGLSAARTLGVPGTPVGSPTDPQVVLFAAFCYQIALALDHIELQQRAIHTEALRESDRLKTALLGSVTHDLRTPLASIQAAAGSLLDETIEWSAADRRAFAETIETSAERLSRLVSNLLDLSRLEAGVAVPDKRWYPFGDIIATVLDRLDLAGRTTGRQIDVALPEDLPLALLDHAQMEQVLTNLIENAIKYSPPESAITVRARVVEPPRELEVRVSDQGIGIPAGELNAIFDKFYRVEHVDLPWDSGRPPTGTGLGLAICRGIVEAHGGRIWAESAPGRGSTFIFRLPLPDSEPRVTLPPIGAEPAQGPASPAELTGASR